MHRKAAKSLSAPPYGSTAADELLDLTLVHGAVGMIANPDGIRAHDERHLDLTLGNIDGMSHVDSSMPNCLSAMSRVFESPASSGAYTGMAHRPFFPENG
jgi:hypothetical protein